ncbi:unnamed protein product [Prunus armeniaca]|uniref:Uncharacterized protein n=1 Tax=Prunus armeniaca TaxID=36596 RepID=A0A6J5VY00_PRUAR|nr:unnamed protein product [Prunus armeniaca]
MRTCLILNLLNHLKAANSMVLLTSSKLSALRAVRSVLIVYTDDVLAAQSYVSSLGSGAWHPLPKYYGLDTEKFLTPNTWFHIIQNHLQLQHVILKLQDKNSLESVAIIMKFFFTVARVKRGAEMLITNGFLSSLRLLFATWTVVITDMVQSLRDSSACSDVVENVIPHFFSEKAYMISYYLSAPVFPSDAKHWNSWVKAMKEMDSQLREKSIHLLAFIRRGTQHLGESSSLNAPLVCPPILKEEFNGCKKPLFVDSRSGWFALSPFSCVSKSKFSAVSTTTALAIKTQSTENSVSQSYLSDTIVLQIYRITFLLLKFLCLQAEGAARRAEEVGFVDLDHFTELPMPEILHGLQIR